MAALLLGAATTTFAQPSKFGQPADRAAPGVGDPAEGERILSEFRRAGIAGDYWLSFELRVMPRKGAERTVTGALYGTQGRGGPLTRIATGEGEWLIEAGPQPAAWVRAGDVAEPAAPGTALADTGVTIFDLQMPFIYWQDFTYEGQARVRGRPTYSLVLRPPVGQPLPMPELTGVRVLIDTQFQALVQAELLGSGGVAIKSISLLDLKKVGGQWLVKTVDVRDHRTRDKTRFTVRAAALDLNWPRDVFSPAGLTQPAPPVPPGRVERF